MPVFEREERYIVFKLSHLTRQQIDKLRALTTEGPRGPAASSHDGPLPTVECVVVESDWPIYEKVWGMIEDQWVGDMMEESADHADR